MKIIILISIIIVVVLACVDYIGWRKVEIKLPELEPILVP